MYRTWGKRCLDLLLVVPGMVLALPVLLVIAGLVRIKLGSPVLFCQQRPGLAMRVKSKDSTFTTLYRQGVLKIANTDLRRKHRAAASIFQFHHHRHI